MELKLGKAGLAISFSCQLKNYRVSSHRFHHDCSGLPLEGGQPEWPVSEAGGNVVQLPPGSLLFQISRLLGRMYSEMIFVNGFVHCDPHPGNVLVRKRPDTGKVEIVLLDHGLYQVGGPFPTGRPQALLLPGSEPSELPCPPQKRDQMAR